MSGPPRPPVINLQARPPGQILVRNESGQYHLVRMAVPGSNVFSAPVQVSNPPVHMSAAAGQAHATRPVYIRTAIVQPVKLGQNQQYVLQSTQSSVIQNPQYIAQNVQAPMPHSPHQQTSGFNQQPVILVTNTQAITSNAATLSKPSEPGGSGATAQSKLDAQQAFERTKHKCRDFLANLLDLSQKEYKTTETKVRMLVQSLINAEIEPEAFCTTLEQILEATPQPSLIGFLKKSLPPLRQAMIANELQIEGIKVPIMDPSGKIIPSYQLPYQQPPQMQSAIIHKPQPAIQKTPTSVHLSLRQVRPASPQLYSTANMQIQPPQQPKPTVQILSNQPVKPSTSFHIQPAEAPKPKKVIAGPSTATNVDKTVNDDDLNDVAAMGGIDLAEEYKKVLGSTENIGTVMRSCKDDYLMELGLLHARVCQASARNGLSEPQQDVTKLISHAVEQYLKNYIEKLACIAEHRNFKEFQSSHVVSQNVKGQLKFLEDVDKVESQRQKDIEREVLLRAVKSKSKVDNLEQKSLKEKGKELQRMEMEEIRLKDANLTALQAIGSKKKAKMEQPGPSGVTNVSRAAAKPTRIKRVNYRDMLFLLENEKETRRSTFLYKAYLKNSSK